MPFLSSGWIVGAKSIRKGSRLETIFIPVGGPKAHAKLVNNPPPPAIDSDRETTVRCGLPVNQE